MPRSRVTFDDKEFRGRFTEIALQEVPNAAKTGMGQAALQLMDDAILIEPTVPLKTGRTRGSGTAFVQKKLVGDSQEHTIPREGQDKGVATPAKSFTQPLPSDSIVGTVLFNTEYAWEIHEFRPIGWSKRRALPFHEPSAEIKWLETKLIGFRDKYFGIVAKQVQEALGR